MKSTKRKRCRGFFVCEYCRRRDGAGWSLPFILTRFAYGRGFRKREFFVAVTCWRAYRCLCSPAGVSGHNLAVFGVEQVIAPHGAVGKGEGAEVESVPTVPYGWCRK